MKIENSSQTWSEATGGWLVVGVWEEEPANLSPSCPEPLAKKIARLAQSGDFEGKPNETLPIYDSAGTGADRVLLLGLGKRSSVTTMILSRAAGTAVRALTRKKIDRILVPILGHGSAIELDARTTACLVGAIVAEGGQDAYRAKKNRQEFGTLVLLEAGSPGAIERGKIMGEAVRGAAGLVNLPPDDIHPESFCEKLRQHAKGTNVAIEVLDADALESGNFRCILGVGRGSSRPPKLLVMRYSGASGDQRTLAWVGKGVTFDSGGLSIKPADGMMTMKCDMAGASAVTHAIVAAARLKLPVNILVLAPLVENMPGGKAIKPGDVLRAKNGKTIEVLNTDAEGRLILADALSYAVELGANHIVDAATLTGACMVALGMQVAGVMTNNDAWAETVLASAKRTGERMWPLPMFEEYDDLIKSGVADMKNIGGRWGGAITAAKLLANFVGEVPWVHVDIAGPAFSETEASYQDAGGTGFLVRTLVELAEDYARIEDRS